MNDHYRSLAIIELMRCTRAMMRELAGHAEEIVQTYGRDGEDGQIIFADKSMGREAARLYQLVERSSRALRDIRESLYQLPRRPSRRKEAVRFPPLAGGLDSNVTSLHAYALARADHRLTDPTPPEAA